MNGLLVATGCAAVAGAAASGAYVGLVTGRLTLDLGVGRRTRPLSPVALDIAAPRETVYAAAAAPTPTDSHGPCRRKSKSSNALVRWSSPRTAPPSDPV